MRNCAMGGLILLLASGCQKSVTAPPPPPPTVTVEFVHPQIANVAPFEEFGGRAVASVTIDLKARVSGNLEKVHFQDGADVAAGELLFEIDDRSYAADNAVAIATVQQRKADYDRLKANLERTRRLRAENASTDLEVERLTYEADAALAAHSAAIAARDRTQLNVEFSKIYSPIAGQIGRRLVDEGNLIQAESTAMAVIVALDPIYVYFDYDERSVLAMRRLVEDGKLPAAPDRNQPVSLALAGEDRYDLSGMIDWVDNQIDLGTGTLRARVHVKNERRLLTPGMFVRLRVPLGPKQASLLIPEQALVADQGQRFVYVVTPDDKIEYRRVEVGWQEAGQRVITSGLKELDRVVVTGLQRIKAKSNVIAKPWTPGTAADTQQVSHGDPAAAVPSTPVPATAPPHKP